MEDYVKPIKYIPLLRLKEKDKKITVNVSMDETKTLQMEDLPFVPMSEF